ncbi:hypothetical protein [Helicobacter sp. 11S02629-2]|uniref:hypothetical protein n=1 Tax=Helicobacter sp. 11S02629-2 TaxID=1476195 RepID=UPI000BA78440|nr:hypothetical protein [Helicobacter sp. 11S02629-2]PAF41387.1 hypothetical protein BKH40_08415 [Helicobacter sp. 11S02629-2]
MTKVENRVTSLKEVQALEEEIIRNNIYIIMSNPAKDEQIAFFQKHFTSFRFCVNVEVDFEEYCTEKFPEYVDKNKNISNAYDEMIYATSLCDDLNEYNDEAKEAMQEYISVFSKECGEIIEDIVYDQLVNKYELLKELEGEEEQEKLLLIETNDYDPKKYFEELREVIK